MAYRAAIQQIIMQSSGESLEGNSCLFNYSHWQTLKNGSRFVLTHSKEKHSKQHSRHLVHAGNCSGLPLTDCTKADQTFLRNLSSYLMDLVFVRPFCWMWGKRAAACQWPALQWRGLQPLRQGLHLPTPGHSNSLDFSRSAPWVETKYSLSKEAEVKCLHSLWARAPDDECCCPTCLLMGKTHSTGCAAVRKHLCKNTLFLWEEPVMPLPWHWKVSVTQSQPQLWQSFFTLSPSTHFAQGHPTPLLQPWLYK